MCRIRRATGLEGRGKTTLQGMNGRGACSEWSGPEGLSMSQCRKLWREGDD